MARGKQTFSKSSGKSGWVQWLGLALILLLIDQFTKVLIVGNYRLGDSTFVTSFFNVVRVHNTGGCVLVSGRCGRLAALVFYRHRICGGGGDHLDVARPPGAKVVQLCHGLHFGRRDRQCD